MDLLGPALAAALALAALAGLVGYLFLVQYGRLLLRMEALERRLAELESARAGGRTAAGGLPTGSVMLDFELADLAGAPTTLSRWRGRRVALIFLEPRCATCRRVLSALAATVGDPMPLVVAVGDPAECRAVLDGRAIPGPVLLEEDTQLAALNAVEVGPAAYLVDEQGLTAAPLAVGARAVLALAGAGPWPDAEDHRHEFGQSPFGPPPAPRIGAPAPSFRVPRLGGGHLTLEAFRGRPVLLAFVDPSCEPCAALLPDLEQIHRRSSDLQILAIGRGEWEECRVLVARHGVSFPVGVQRHWEVSRAYGPLGAPIGYLIDERGALAAGPAVGSEAILHLAIARTRAEGPGAAGATHTSVPGLGRP